MIYDNISLIPLTNVFAQFENGPYKNYKIASVGHSQKQEIKLSDLQT